MNTKHVTLYLEIWGWENRKNIVVGNKHKSLLLGIYKYGKYSWNCFFKQNEGWWMKLRYYFTNYFFLCMVRFKCAIAVSKINNRTIIITSLRALLLLQMKNWSTSFPFFPLFWNSRIVSWWNVTNNFPLGVCSIFKQFCLYFLQR